MSLRTHDTIDLTSFYNFEFYINNLSDIFKIWQGGMSFHGGVIGIIIASYLFAKKNSQSSFSYLDIVSFVAPIGIFFGRIANFMNSELYGKKTEFFFTFLESIWKFLIGRDDSPSRLNKFKKSFVLLINFMI